MKIEISAAEVGEIVRKSLEEDLELVRSGDFDEYPELGEALETVLKIYRVQ